MVTGSRADVEKKTAFKAFGIAAAAAATLLAASPADAQRTGSHIERRSDVQHDLNRSNPQAGLLALDDMGACYADRSTARARRLLALPFGSGEQNELVEELASGEDRCVQQGYMIRSSTSLLISALAENMAEQDLGQPRDGEVREVDAQSFAAVQPQVQTPAERLGACVAAKHPNGVLAFLATRPGDAEEMEHLRTLVPTLSSCVPAGQQLSADPRSLRATVAIGLYRTVQAADGGG